jgi:16S rRNA processing protein RimM
VVARPHGLDGSFHVRDPMPVLLRGDGYVRLGGDAVRITRRAGTDARPILRLEGHDTREAAEALRGRELRVAAGEAPALGEDEWYAHELEGCRVHDGEREVGTVRRLSALPSCEVLEVSRPGREDLLVPLVHDAIREVDVEGRRVEVDLGFLAAG